MTQSISTFTEESKSRRGRHPEFDGHTPRQRPDAGSSTEFDVGLLLVTLRRCWMWATPIGLALAAVAAYVVNSQFVPMYRATHVLEKNQDYIVFKGVLDESRNLAATEQHLVLSNEVLDQAATNDRIRAAYPDMDIDGIRNQIRKSLSFGRATSSSLFQITCEHPERDLSAEIANSVTKAYLAKRETVEAERAANLEAWLAPSLQFWKAEVANHEARVRELSKAVLGFDSSQQIERLENDLSVLASIRRDLSNLVVEESMLQARLASAEQQLSEREIGDDEDFEAALLASMPKFRIVDPSVSEVEQFVANHADVKAKKQEIAKRKGMIKSLEDRGLAGIRKDYYQQLENEIEELNSELGDLQTDIRATAPETLRARALEQAKQNWIRKFAEQESNSAAGVQAKRQQLADLRSRMTVLQDQYDQERARLERKGGSTADLRFAQEDREVAARILGMLNERIAAIRTERQRGSGVYSLSAATVPNSPIEPVPLKKMIVFGGGAFFLPFMLGLLWELRAKRISDISSLEKRSLAPVMGEVARIPSNAGSGRRQRVFEESIDSLRANLMLSKETRNVRSITIASSMSGEGKSSVSSQLAISLAKACGKTVLLVDADLRSPDQHNVFGLDMGPGLAKVLSGESSFDEAIDKSLGDLVHVMPAGIMTQSPHRLLNASAIRDLIDHAMDSYAFVVIDTAPVLAAGESLAIASETDATLVCVMRDLSRTESTLRAQRRLEAAGANVVGTVFSGVPFASYSYRYGNYKYLTAGKPKG